MKELAISALSVAIASFIALTGCKSLKKEAQSSSPSKTATTEALDDKETYRQQAEAELQELNTQIAQLQTQIEPASTGDIKQVKEQFADLQAKVQLRAQLNAEVEQEMNQLAEQLEALTGSDRRLETLLEQQAVAKKKLEALNGANEETWQQAKQEADEAIATLKSNYSQLQPQQVQPDSQDSQ